MKAKWIFISGVLVIVTLMYACQNQSRGFVLPDGDIQKGKALFVSLQCTDCHSMDNIAWTGSKTENDPEVKLGGKVTSLKMYGELVTSVINPSHKISPKFLAEQQMTMPEGSSKMETRHYNEMMTVQQLVDLVAYLQSEYKLVKPTVPYPYYPYY